MSEIHGSVEDPSNAAGTIRVVLDVANFSLRGYRIRSATHWRNTVKFTLIAGIPAISLWQDSCSGGGGFTSLAPRHFVAQ